MGAQTVMTPARLAVRPGSESSAQITVTNNGRVVDSYALDVLGPAGQWATCEPANVSVFPGQSAVAQLVFRPPVGAEVPAGPMTFGVHVRSHEDPQGSVVDEGVLDIEPMPLVSAELSPKTGRARGHRRSRHQVAIDNRGNAPALVSLAGFDDQDAVDVTVDPPQVEIGPGSAAFVKVRARGVHRFWRGPAQTRPFAVDAQPADAPPIRMQATLLHEAAVPGWLPKAMMAAAAVAVALTLLWFGLFKPVVKDTATNAAQNAAHAALSSAHVTPGGTGAGGGGAGGGGGGAPSSTAPPTVPPTSPSTTASKPKTTAPPKPVAPSAVPFAVQLDTTNQALTADAKKTLNVTDLVLQNPAPNNGTLAITRDGQSLFKIRLQDFRDYDLHFVTPIVLSAGQSLTMQASCTGVPPSGCTPTVFVSGTIATVSP